ncbi:MAG TPA: hypothetical protein VIN36_10445, partial [Thiobacillus sp.]
MDKRNEYRIVGDILGNYEAQFRRPRGFPWSLFGKFGPWLECAVSMCGEGGNTNRTVELAEEVAVAHANREFNK